MSQAEQLLLGLPYAREAYPLSFPLISNGIGVANCQALAQYFHWLIFGIFVEPPDCLSSACYEDSRYKTIIERHSETFFYHLQFGDVILAHNLVLPYLYPDTPWKTHLHVAIFIGSPTDKKVVHHFPSSKEFPKQANLILTTTSDKKGSQLVTTDQFLKSYFPVRARRLPEL